MLKSLVVALALLVTLGISPYAPPAQAADACLKFDKVLKTADANGWKTAKLDAADAKAVLADLKAHVDEVPAHVVLIYLSVKSDDAGDKMADLILVDGKGCIVGAYRADVDHLQTILPSGV